MSYQRFPAAAPPTVARRRVAIAGVGGFPTPAFARRVAVPRIVPRGAGKGVFVILGPTRGMSGLGAVNSFFQNITRPDRAPQVGDTLRWEISGAPNKPVFISGGKRGQAQGKTQMGATDASGRFVLQPTMSKAEIGQWEQYPWIGDEQGSLLVFEVTDRPEAQNAYQPNTSSVAPYVNQNEVAVQSDAAGMPGLNLTVGDLRTRLFGDESMRERDYMWYQGLLTPPGPQMLDYLRRDANDYCNLYPGACAGANREAIVQEVHARYADWYNKTGTAYWNLIDRTSSTPNPAAPPRPAGYVAPTTYTSGAGYQAQQQTQQQQQNGQQQSGGSTVQTAGAPSTQNSAGSGSSSGGSSSGGSSGGGGTAGSSSSASFGDIGELLGKTFQVGDYSIPFWAAGAGLVGAYFLFGGKR